MSLQLYCQQPGCWHPTEEGGRYEIVEPKAWITTIGTPFLKKLFGVLKFTTPLIGPWIGLTAPGTYIKQVEHQLRLMEELIKQLPAVHESARDWRSSDADPYEGARFEGANLRALRQFLEEKDSQRQWGGLKKVLTPEGHYLWLCKHHAQEYAR